MDDTLGGKVKRAAEEVRQRLSETVQTASDRLSVMRHDQRLKDEIRKLERERAQCRGIIADLVIRMFDQQAFMDALLRPEYTRIKEIDAEIARLTDERKKLGAPADAEGAPATDETSPAEAPEPASSGEIVVAPEALPMPADETPREE